MLCTRMLRSNAFVQNGKLMQIHTLAHGLQLDGYISTIHQHNHLLVDFFFFTTSPSSSSSSSSSSFTFSSYFFFCFSFFLSALTSSYSLQFKHLTTFIHCIYSCTLLNLYCAMEFCCMQNQRIFGVHFIKKKIVTTIKYSVYFCTMALHVLFT